MNENQGGDDLEWMSEDEDERFASRPPMHWLRLLVEDAEK